MSFISPLEAQKKIALYVKKLRLDQDLTQAGLSLRSGIPLSTLKKFERTGQISLRSLCLLFQSLGALDTFLSNVTSNEHEQYSSLDELLAEEKKQKKTKKRGSKT